MRTALVLSVATMIWSTAAADDRAEAEAKVREYFDAFNAKDVDGILSQIYSIPVHVGTSGGHRAYETEDDARASLAGLYEQIEAQGWVRSVITNVDACIVSEGLVFAEVTYTRDRSDGDAIAPGLRSNVYVVQKLAAGWRITAFYRLECDDRGRERSLTLSCKQRGIRP